MSDADRLTPADPKDIASALASKLRYRGHNYMNSQFGLAPFPVDRLQRG